MTITPGGVATAEQPHIETTRALMARILSEPSCKITTAGAYQKH